MCCCYFVLQVVSPPDDSVSCLKFGPGTMGSTFLVAGSWDNNVSFKLKVKGYQLMVSIVKPREV